ncbi:ketoacyl-ACP synthase III [Cyanobacterium stanieri LEGE 03274]|uniref:Beta-ketoacyl-[acyl-carrier-protein] synthase III n=1 Tax=Cyanobacterium stanieri LEGE 03274 TaxID=1828756 RepID=A0ABR9V2P7_9CHRO|nr:beta-ketoacyl-ACP synthase III [Cyanobacterium stanieri]MBE9222155.1 ketoacyl-ACP synthase III [Cyanobacterium stanieri LEGE 03274]
MQSVKESARDAHNGITVIGSGSAIATQVISNDDLSQIVDTSDDWISSRTGIKKRHIATSTSLSELAAQAGLRAIAHSGLTPLDIDLIILATSTPDDLFGSAAQVQSIIGATRAVAFDLTAACSGFVFSLVTASQFIRNGVYRNVLVIGADFLSRWVDWGDRTTCVLFGDGAGAVVCQGNSEKDNLLGFEMCSNGALNNTLNLSYQGNLENIGEDKQINNGGFSNITMNGREVYRFAVNKVPEVIEKALFRAHLTTDDVDWLILHQANKRIIDAVASRLKIPEQKVITNLHNYGNTSAASIPLALDEALKEGKIKSGDVIAVSGFGAGLSWGASIFRWGR